MFTGLLGALVNMILVRRFIGVTVSKQLSANARALANFVVMAAGVWFASLYLPHTTDSVTLALQLAILVALGGLLYCGSTFLLWMLMKRPVGPEAEIQKILGQNPVGNSSSVTIGRQFPAAYCQRMENKECRRNQMSP